MSDKKQDTKIDTYYKMGRAYMVLPDNSMGILIDPSAPLNVDERAKLPESLVNEKYLMLIIDIDESKSQSWRVYDKYNNFDEVFAAGWKFHPVIYRSYPD